MADWRDVMEARENADAAANHAAGRTGHGNGLPLATLALRLELRALGVTLDNALRESRSANVRL